MPNNDRPLRIRTRLKIIGGMPDCLPYLSVFFLMLIFFMLGSSFVQVSGIPVDLPEAQGHSSYGVKKRIVTVAKNGRIYFNDMEIDSPDLFKNKLMEIVNSNDTDKPAIVLRADAGASFGIVAQIMSIAEALNINVFVITAEPKEQQVLRTPAAAE